jgi:exopolyphosphatase/guanosine-5'-triphosphate,3'-diphosphate pyrophosphatase
MTGDESAAPAKRRRRRRRRRRGTAAGQAEGPTRSGEPGETPEPEAAASATVGPEGAVDKDARDPARGGRPGKRRGKRERRSGPPALYGAIDLGTNNCRMLLAQRVNHGFRVVDAFSRVVRLGEGLNATGELSQAAMDRAVEALRVCSEKLARRQVGKHRSIATQACRMASNGEEFLERVRLETGLAFDLISPEEEARLAVHGCVDLLDSEMDAALVIDIGGGSTELSWVDLAQWRERGSPDGGGRPPIKSWMSAPIGVVTLAERFPEHGVDAKGYEEMLAYAREQIRTPRGARSMRDVFAEGRGHLVGTSGTVTSMAGVHLRLPRYERARVDGLWMGTADAAAACERLRDLGREGRAKEPSIGADRAELVLAGCAIYEAVAEAWPATRLRVGDRGLREGLLLNLMRKPKRRRRRRREAGEEAEAAE